jgi:glycosyltransferase involved in cell wall biosynthesis
MKILFVSLFLPQEKSYHAGGRYVFEIIRGLSQRHEIHLVTRLEENELPLLGSLRPFCRAIYPYTYSTTQGRKNLLSLAALGLNYLGFSRYADRKASSGHFDLIQVEWVDAAVRLKRRKTPMVLTAHDVITKPAERRMRSGQGLRKLISAIIFLFVRTLELRIMKRFDAVFTLSEYDKKYLLAMGSGVKAGVMPYPAGLDITARTYERQKNTILFLASYKYLRRNVDAALYFYHEVFPRVCKVIPDARFIAAGYGPPADLTALQEMDPAVSVPGFVDDLDECYKRASVFVAPILVGGGIIVKVLDSMAAGTPVVTTTYGNEGIGAVPGRDILIAVGPETFADAVVRVLSDREFADSLSQNGREFVRKNFTFEAAMKKLDAAYEKIVKGRKEAVNSKK